MTVYYTWSNGKVDLECEMEYEPAERETDVAPGIPANAYVIAATFNHVDFTDLLSEETLDQISEDFLKEFENQEGQYEPDYEAMRQWGD